MKAFNRGDDERGLRVFMTAGRGQGARRGDPRRGIPSLRRQRRPVQSRATGRLPQFGEGDARSIRVPTLLVSGADSLRPLTAVTDKLEKLLPEISRLNIPGAGHNMFNTHPKEFNAGVMEFLGRH